MNSGGTILGSILLAGGGAFLIGHGLGTQAVTPGEAAILLLVLAVLITMSQVPVSSLFQRLRSKAVTSSPTSPALPGAKEALQ